MTALSLEQALENIYACVNGDNEDIDAHIAALKAAMIAGGRKDVSVDPARLVHNNRESRKLMQSYFRKRGVSVNFAAGTGAA
jgi:hypothetical protein